MVRDMALIGQRNTLTIVRASVPGLYLDGGALDMIVDRRQLRQTIAHQLAMLQRQSADAVA